MALLTVKTRSMGGSVAADIAAYLPQNTISGVFFLAAVAYADKGLPLVATDEINSIVAALGTANDVAIYRAAVQLFVESCFVRPKSLPYAKRCMYAGHGLSAEVLLFVMRRSQDPESLLEAGRAGLPLFVIYGSGDRHIKGDAVVDIMKPHFKDMTVRRVEGGSHALHEEFADEVVEALLDFVGRIGGKVSVGLGQHCMSLKRFVRSHVVK